MRKKGKVGKITQTTGDFAGSGVEGAKGSESVEHEAGPVGLSLIEEPPVEEPPVEEPPVETPPAVTADKKAEKRKAPVNPPASKEKQVIRGEDVLATLRAQGMKV